MSARSNPGDEAGYRIATEVMAPTTGTGGGTTTAGPIPPSMRRLERQIERNARLYHFGVRAGVALDPELISIGVQAQVGPVFSRTISFRPSVEFAYGEVTSLFAINPEFLYRLPVSSRDGRWTAYTGAGPGFTFLEQDFNRTTGQGKRINFGEFHSSTGLNILGGIQFRSGVFTELKTSVYAEPTPTLRLIIGYNF